MAQTCIGTATLIAGSLFCGIPSALPAAGVRTVAEPPAAPMSAAGRGPCRSSARVCGPTLSQAQVVPTPVEIISDHIRRQGYACDEPREAERDRAASRPNETVWILRCGNATYRVTLIPDMAARVERLK
jgi:hypothetical protein